MPIPDHPTADRPLAALAVATGALMAGYLLLRPYGDAGGDTAAVADALASPLWIWSHLAGATALVTMAALWSALSDGPARWAALTGSALALPYYGAEMFGLHAIGIRAQTDPEALSLVPAVRDNPVALTMFGIGLIALAAAGAAAALHWRRARTRDRHSDRAAGAFVPLAMVSALFLPQFFLPPAGRVTYGILFAVAALYAANAIRDPAGVRASSVADEGRGDSAG